MKNLFSKKLISVGFLILLVLAGCSNDDAKDVKTTEPDKSEIDVSKDNDTNTSDNNTSENTKTETKSDSNSTKNVDENQTVTNETPKFGNSKDISYEVGFENATVVKITDGDTLTVKTESGEELKLRLLLIDTPETVHPSKPIQPFGPEASSFAKEFMPVGSTVQVEYDVSGKSLDKYGRTLAYIWKDGKMYNEEVLLKGFARVAYIYAPNTRHVDLFNEAQKKAQQAKLGIWSIEDYVHSDGFESDDKTSSNSSSNTSSSSSNSSSNNNSSSSSNTSSSSSCNIKGNKGSKEWIYHLPGGAYYDKTQAEEMFCTTEEAEAAGYRASKR